jgi:hypothetical protein
MIQFPRGLKQKLGSLLIPLNVESRVRRPASTLQPP